jgi:hypothetical protein
MKVTSEKSWKVVSGLIRQKSSSIRNLSLVQGVSYGWTHSTVTNLIVHGIAKRNGNRASIVDIDKLLNGVAWERPTQTLIVKELILPGTDVFEVARDLTAILDDENVPRTFACYIAGTQYAGQSVRFDSLQVYMDKDEIDEALGWLSLDGEGPGIRIQIMAPDRELFSEAQIIGGIRVTSPITVLIGGWAVYPHNPWHGSIEIDLIRCISSLLQRAYESADPLGVITVDDLLQNGASHDGRVCASR